MEINCSRKKKLKFWLLEKDISLKTIADAVGVTPQRIGYILSSETITPEMFRKLSNVGVPGDVMPPIVPKKPGARKRIGTL